MKRNAFVLAGVAVAMTLSGCMAADGDNDQVTAETQDIKWDELDTSKSCSEETPGVGGTFNLQAYTEGTGFEPASSTYSLEAGRQVFGGLMRYNRETKEFDAWYAESLEPNEDSTSWTLKLKDGPEWSDGTPLTAEAVKRSVERFADPALPNAYASQAKLIDEMTVVDDQTLRFDLTEPWGTFEYFLAQPPGEIINPKVLDRLSTNEITNNLPPEAGLGAFVLTKWNKGRNMVLTAKDDWWGGKICIDDINVTWNPAGQASIEAMVAGQVDYFHSWESPAFKVGLADENIKVIEGNPIATPLVFNMKNANVQSAKMRQGMQLAANADVLVERIMDGYGYASHSIVSPTSQFADDVEPLPYDVERAKELLEEAEGEGWNGSLAYSINAVPNNVNQAILQGSMAEQAGVDFERIELPIGEWYQKVVVQRDYELTQAAIQYDPSCAWCGFAPFESTNPGNYSQADLPELDEAIKQVRAASTEEDTAAALVNLQEVWNEHMPAAVAAWLAQGAFISDRVEGLSFGISQSDSIVEAAYLTR